MATKVKRKTLVGTVISDSMDKSIVVSVKKLIKHPVYKKYIRRSSKFYAHDPKNSCREGDLVEIIQSRPLSKKKRWRLLNILEQE